MKNFIYFLLMSGFFCFSSCNKSDNDNPLNSNNKPKILTSLSGTMWRWYSYETKSGIKVLVKDSTKEIHILRFTSQSTLDGYAGRNDYWGAYSIVKDTMIIDGITKDDGPGRLVAKYFRILDFEKKSLYADDSTLTMFTNDTNNSIVVF